VFGIETKIVQLLLCSLFGHKQMVYKLICDKEHMYSQVKNNNKTNETSYNRTSVYGRSTVFKLVMTTRSQWQSEKSCVCTLLGKAPNDVPIF